MRTSGYAAFDAQTFKPYSFDIPEVGPKDVHIEVHYCGICHSDIHTVREDWKTVDGRGAKFPLVPGHEIAGVVKAVGGEVTKYKVGDRVGVGCLVGSCKTCTYCDDKEEQLCKKKIPTYNKTMPDGSITKGGYSREMVVNEDFVLRIPDNIPLDQAAPLLCAGITTYGAMKRYEFKAGSKVGVVGLGGLGHVGVQIAKELGCDVWVLSHSESKRDDAAKLGAKGFINSSSADEMNKHMGTFTYILDTTSSSKDMTTYVNLLEACGVVVIVGLPTEQYKVSPCDLVWKSKAIAGSLIGGIKQTQEMLDFCGEHNVRPWIEVIPMKDIEEAYKKIESSSVKYRFVIDVKNTAPPVESQ